MQLNPHLSEMDLLLLFTWLGHIHYVQLDPILLGTGDQSKQSQSNLPIQLTKKALFVMAENVGSGCASPMCVKERESTCIQRGRENQTHRQEQRETTFLVYIVP